MSVGDAMTLTGRLTPRRRILFAFGEQRLAPRWLGSIDAVFGATGLVVCPAHSGEETIRRVEVNDGCPSPSSSTGFPRVGADLPSLGGSRISTRAKIGPRSRRAVAASHARPRACSTSLPTPGTPPSCPARVET